MRCSLAIESIETVLVRVPLGRVFRGSHYEMTHRSTVITRIRTASGIVGEAYAGDEDAGLHDIDAIIHTEIAPRLIGQDACAIERCWALARPATFDILRDRLAGMKLKVGGLAPEEDAARFRRARAAAGPDFVLCADANQGWTTSEALRFARAVANCELRWFEEPCRWDGDRRDARRPDEGGRRRLRGPERAVGRRLPRVDGATHLLAAIPHGTYAECFEPERDPIWWNLVANRPPLRDGQLELSDRPGLGWELDPEYVERHRLPARRVATPVPLQHSRQDSPSWSYGGCSPATRPK